MATSEILTIGSVVRHRGSYNADTVYYTNNQVTMCNCVFQAIGNNFSGIAPVEKKSDGTIKFANTTTWKCIVDNVDLYNATLSTNSLGDRLTAAEKTVQEAKDAADAANELVESKGASNGIAPLDSNAQIPIKYLPSTSVNNVLEFDKIVSDVTALEATALEYTGIAYDTAANKFYAYTYTEGLAQPYTYYCNWTDGGKWQDDFTGVPYKGKLYVDTSTEILYRWDGNGLVKVSENKQVVSFNGMVVGADFVPGSTASPMGVVYDTAAKRFFAFVQESALSAKLSYYANWGTRRDYQDLDSNIPHEDVIFINTSDNLPYRWNGEELVEVSSSLGLGTTSETAFPGDRGLALETEMTAAKASLAKKAEKTELDAAKEELQEAIDTAHGTEAAVRQAADDNLQGEIDALDKFAVMSEAEYEALSDKDEGTFYMLTED